MHEEMDMTEMQFMNTGAREIVPFLDTTSWGSMMPDVCIQEGDTDLPLVCQREGIKMKPVHDKAQHRNVHSTTLSKNKYNQRGTRYSTTCMAV